MKRPSKVFAYTETILVEDFYAPTSFLVPAKHVATTLKQVTNHDVYFFAIALLVLLFFYSILAYYNDNNNSLKIITISFCRVIRFYLNKIIAKYVV